MQEEKIAALKDQTVPSVLQMLEKHIQANGSPKGYIFGSKVCKIYNEVTIWQTI